MPLTTASSSTGSPATVGSISDIADAGSAAEKPQAHELRSRLSDKLKHGMLTPPATRTSVAGPLSLNPQVECSNHSGPTKNPVLKINGPVETLGRFLWSASKRSGDFFGHWHKRGAAGDWR